MILYQDFSSRHDSSKNMATRGRGLFSLYICIENLKSSCQKPLDLLQYNLAGMFLWLPATKIVQAIMIPQKTWTPGGRGLFSLYIYIHVENFQNLLVRNHWTDFNVIRQECSYGDPLPRLFKPSWFVKIVIAKVQGLFSLSLYIETLKIFFSETTGPVSILLCWFKKGSY